MNPKAVHCSLYSFCIVILSITVITTSLRAYTPVLPKTGETDSVIVLDMGLEKAKGKGNCYSALHTITSLQGLINRSNRTKILFTNMPIRVFYESENPDGANGNVVDPGSAIEHMLEDGLVPYPLLYPKVNAASDHPVLEWLLERYSYLIKGKVLFTEFWNNDYYGSIAAATNACTFESYLPVQKDVDAWMKQNGFNFDLKADVSDMSTMEAMNWTLHRHFGDSRRNNSFLGFYSSPAIMNDYCVATYAFMYFLHGEKKDEYTIIDTFIRPEYYLPSAVSIGNIEAVRMIPHLAERGYTAVCGQAPNLSMTSSIPTNPSEFAPAPSPKVHPIDSSGLYLCFAGNDGDAFDFGYMIAYKNFRNDPAAGQVPFAMKINPYFIDVFPTFFAWHTRWHRETMDVVSSMNDGGMSITEEGQAGWQKQFGNYWDNCNNSLRIIHFFGPLKKVISDKGTDKILMSFKPLYIIRGYQQSLTDKDSRWLFQDGTAYSNQIGFAGDDGVIETINGIKTAIDSVQNPDEPIFMMVRMGIDTKQNINTRRGGKGISYAKEIMDSLKAQKTIKRNLYFIPARDLAATALAFNQGNFQNKVRRPLTPLGVSIYGNRSTYYNLRGQQIHPRKLNRMRGVCIIKRQKRHAVKVEVLLR